VGRGGARHGPLHSGSRDGPSIVNRLFFVFITAALVALYAFALSRALPPLRSEPPALLLYPVTAISLVVSLALYPVVRKHESRSGHARALYVAFVVSAALYGCYLWKVIPHATAGMIPLALVAAHLYGAPLYGVVFIVQRLVVRPASKSSA